jgi:hypothetical protein
MDNNNPTSSPQEQHVSNPIQNQSSTPASTPQNTTNSQNKIDTDSIGNFITEIFNKTIETYKNPKLLTPLVITGVISWAILMLPVFGGFSLALIGILGLISIILSIIYSFAVVSIALKAAQGIVPTMNDVTKPLSRIPSYIVSYIKILIQFFIGLFKPPFIIPGFKYAIGSSLFVMENLNKETPQDQAIKNSLEMTKGNILNMFCTVIVIAILSMVLGIIPFAIGTIISTPFGAVAAAHIYLKFKK